MNKPSSLPIANSKQYWIYVTWKWRAKKTPIGSFVVAFNTHNCYQVPNIQYILRSLLSILFDLGQDINSCLCFWTLYIDINKICSLNKFIHQIQYNQIYSVDIFPAGIWYLNWNRRCIASCIICSCVLRLSRKNYPICNSRFVHSIQSTIFKQKNHPAEQCGKITQCKITGHYSVFIELAS